MNLQEQLELARGTNEKLRIKIQQMKGALRRHKNTTPVYTSKVPLKQGTDECIEEFLLTTRKVYTEGLIQNFPVLQDFIVVSVRNLLRPPNGKRYDSNSGLYLRMMLCLKNMGCANGVDFICRNMNGPSNRTIDGDLRNRSAALSICSWETINNFSDREYRDKYGTIFNSIQ
eukprot:TRINITY_DN622_c0_g1_i9.p1 TRINITY_DN622_c0_g1~~TRINITY_DN622_c0_g1_i9.p1  ORF type:complete len:172 (+),score=35.43 TRINITY_DN622_c0_g1_i9:1015-1530(+)